MTCDEVRGHLVEALYGELSADVQREIDVHLASCAECSEEFGTLKATHAMMDQRRREEPGINFRENLWKNISNDLGLGEDDTQAKVTPMRAPAHRTVRIPGWAYSIAATLLIAVGIYLGRNYFGKQEAGIVQSPGLSTFAPVNQPEDSVTAQAVVYLERSRNLLLGLANLDEEHRSSLDLAGKQEISRQLVEQASVLTVSLNRPNQQQIRQLIMDLEVILLQLANVEVKPGVPAIEMVRKGIDQKSILLKINVEEMRAMANRTPPPQKPKTSL
jgi:hypothetical protein